MRASEGAVNSRVYSTDEKDLVSLQDKVEEPVDGDTISQFQGGGELFSNIVGYEDIKKLFHLSLYSKERPVHIASGRASCLGKNPLYVRMYET